MSISFQHLHFDGLILPLKVSVERMVLSQLIKENGYEAKQVSLLYVFVNIFGLDRAQSTIDFEMC